MGPPHKKAVRKYLAQYAAPECALAANVKAHYAHVVVVPVCNEPANFYQGFEDADAAAGGPVLFIIVVNGVPSAPATTHRQNLETLEVLRRNQKLNSIVLDRASPKNMFPEGEGVGLARRIGGDLALKLWAQGKVWSPWIHMTDADAVLPKDYFSVRPPPDVVALTYPFWHEDADDALILYELSASLLCARACLGRLTLRPSQCRQLHCRLRADLCCGARGPAKASRRRLLFVE